MRVPLWQTALEALPARAAIGRAPDGGATLRHAAGVPRVERDDIEAVAIVRMHGRREAEVARKALRDLGPGLAGVVAPVHAAVVLLVEALSVRRRHHELVHAVAHLGVIEGPGRAEPAVARRPGRSIVRGLEDAVALDDGPEARGIVG